MFSILIPTWNNLDYLKLCVSSIRKYSSQPHEIIIHVNDGQDGTLDWVKAQGLRHSHSAGNIGICLAVNHIAAQASGEWLVYMNVDMVCCPGWDSVLMDAIDSVDTDLAMFSCTLMEPAQSTNHLILHHDFGKTPDQFNEQLMLDGFMKTPRGNTWGAATQPTVISRRWWNMVGGYSTEYSPGMSSDDDLLMKMWIVGCRVFVVVGASRVYHFSCRSTGRIRHNRGGSYFAVKWGITSREFQRLYLARITSAAIAESDNRDESFPRVTLLGRLKRLTYGLGRALPLEDIGAWKTFSAGDFKK